MIANFLIPTLLAMMAAGPPPQDNSAAAVKAQTQAATTIPSELNLSIPSSPAADLLGLTGSGVTQISSLQQAVGSVLSGGPSSGSSSTGYDILLKSTNLGLTHSRQNLGTYYANPGQRALFNLQMSIAVANTPNLPQAFSKGAVTIGTTLIDFTDWRPWDRKRQAYLDQVAPYVTMPVEDLLKGVPPLRHGDAWVSLDVLRQHLNDIKGATPSDTKPKDATGLHVMDKDEIAEAAKTWKEVNDFLGTRSNWQLPVGQAPSSSPLMTADDLTAYASLMNDVQTFRDNYVKKQDPVFYAQAAAEAKKLSDQSWNQPQLAVALGGASQSDGTTAFSTQGFGGWMTYAVPGPSIFGSTTQLLAYGKYFNSIDQKIGSMTNADFLTGYTGALRLRGGSSNFAGFAEYEYTQGKPSGGASVFDHVFQLGVDYKVGTQWLELGVGKSLQNGHNLVLGLQFAMSFATNPPLDNHGGPAPAKPAANGAAQ